MGGGRRVWWRSAALGMSAWAGVHGHWWGELSVVPAAVVVGVGCVRGTPRPGARCGSCGWRLGRVWVRFERETSAGIVHRWKEGARSESFLSNYVMCRVEVFSLAVVTLVRGCLAGSRSVLPAAARNRGRSTWFGREGSPRLGGGAGIPSYHGSPAMYLRRSWYCVGARALGETDYHCAPT